MNMHIDASMLQNVIDKVMDQNRDKMNDLGYSITQSIDGFTNSNSEAGLLIFNQIINNMGLSLYVGQSQYLSDKLGIKHE